MTDPENGDSDQYDKQNGYQKAIVSLCTLRGGLFPGRLRAADHTGLYTAPHPERRCQPTADPRILNNHLFFMPPVGFRILGFFAPSIFEDLLLSVFSIRREKSRGGGRQPTQHQKQYAQAPTHGETSRHLMVSAGPRSMGRKGVKSSSSATRGSQFMYMRPPGNRASSRQIMPPLTIALRRKRPMVR